MYKFFQCFNFPSSSFIFSEQSLQFFFRLWMRISPIYNLDTILFAVFLKSMRCISIFISFYSVKLSTMINDFGFWCPYMFILLYHFSLSLHLTNQLLPQCSLKYIHQVLISFCLLHLLQYIPTAHDYCNTSQYAEHSMSAFTRILPRVSFLLFYMPLLLPRSHPEHASTFL